MSDPDAVPAWLRDLRTCQRTSYGAMVDVGESHPDYLPHTEKWVKFQDLLAACPPQSAAPAWQDIATAPKDGTKIVIFAKWRGGQEIAVARWNDQREDSRGPVWESGFATSYQPTIVAHWMPLPAHPVSSPAPPGGEP